MVFVEDEAYEDIGAGRTWHADGGRPRPPDTRAPQTPRCANEREGPARSSGSANGGHLANGCELPRSGPGYIAHSRNRWGTDDAVGLVQWAAARVAALRPGSVPVVIRDLSDEDGGRLRPHRSHQSGRDVDIGYFAANNETLSGFVEMGAGNLDPDKTWLLIEALLSTGRVRYLFMDYEIQAVLVRWLEDLDADPGLVERLFQYPAGPGVARGIIRHARGHADHFHVRFACGETDGDACED